MVRKDSMKNIAVFASGAGTNFEAIVKAVKKKTIKARIALLVSDQPKAGAIARAGRAGIKIVLVEMKNFSNILDFEAKIIQALKEENIDLIALAGFMRMLSAGFVREYKGRIINIHPALLPSFRGTSAIKDAYAYGVKFTGVTVHFVDEEMDHGPIILQEAIPIKDNDTLESLEERVHEVEHKLYPYVVKLFVEDRLSIEGRKVRIK
ncbi:MAG: phosphoribosylglycinamide formyltransferase [Candidatus Omnitrophota bacterium]